GIGFAIPSSLARPVIEQLKAKGKVSRGWLGVQIQELTPAIAKSLGLPNDHGALVADVNAGSPAEKAGIKQGDVILEFNGHEIVKLRDLPVVVAETSVGSSATVKVWRRGQEMTLNPTIVEQASSPQDVSTNKGLGNQPSEDVPQNASALGLKLVPLTPELRQQLKVQQNVRGVVVTSISDSSPLADSDLRAGDIIVAINQEPVSSPREAAAKLKAAQAKKGSNVLLQINRHGTNAFIAWSTQDDNG
ncbi:MAG TPA: PDZ domain-containing protein, partial [Stellaceae bacterium]|nr:PDZ domain-containing protein [Stellaceae bacterium]